MERRSPETSVGLGKLCKLFDNMPNNVQENRRMLTRTSLESRVTHRRVKSCTTPKLSTVDKRFFF